MTTTIRDRNEMKFLLAVGFVGTPRPRDNSILDFEFPCSRELEEARRSYALNRPVPVLSFVGASRFVDAAIYEHRMRNSGGCR
jgi:hypothetical protein